MVWGTTRGKSKWGGIALMLVWCIFLGGCNGVAEVNATAYVTKPRNHHSEDIADNKLYLSVEKGVSEGFLKNMEEVRRIRVKGIFVTGPMAGTENMDNLISLVEETELNTIVMDIKNDEGRVVYDMQIQEIQDTGAGIRYVRDMEGLIEKCKDKNIYLIARIVAFKDPYLEKVNPQWCVHNADGSVFRDKDGLAWLNPYNREVWDYLLSIAKEALRIGFDEIQFDYLRFSTDSGMDTVDFGEEGTEMDREEIITEFIKYASAKIHEVGGFISADVYGVVIDSERDQKIVGQNYAELSRYLDYISPMVYPSHYGAYNYNIPVPDAEPYLTVLTAMRQSRRALAGLPTEIPSVPTEAGDDTENNALVNVYEDEALLSVSPMEGITARVRPWLQDFTATWVSGHISYEAEQIRAQIQAVYDAGYEEWILWNASNHYTEDGLLRN